MSSRSITLPSREPRTVHPPSGHRGERSSEHASQAIASGRRERQVMVRPFGPARSAVTRVANPAHQMAPPARARTMVPAGGLRPLPAAAKARAAAAATMASPPADGMRVAREVVGAAARSGASGVGEARPDRRAEVRRHTTAPTTVRAAIGPSTAAATNSDAHLPMRRRLSRGSDTARPPSPLPSTSRCDTWSS